MNIRRLLSFLSVITLSLLGAGVYAQGVTSASMNGRVLDGEGNALEGATVRAVHGPTGSSYGSISNADGYYRMANMRVGGPYLVTVTFIGFGDYSKENVYLTLGQSYRLDIPMQETAVEIGDVIITSYKNDVFDGNRTGAETTVTEEQISALPTVSRAVGDFARLTPQATVREGNDGFAISLNGMNNRFNAIYIDGAVNNDVFGLAGSGTNGGQTGVSPISIDAIEEFQISLAPYDVRVGGFAGGAINAVTRSGSNNLEASVYGFYRDENLAGKTPTDDESAERTKLDNFNAYTTGFRVGGAIVQDKVFFFLNAELQREETPQPFDFGGYRGDASRADLTALESKLVGFGYDPGGFEENAAFLNSEKITAKLDFNLSDDHKLSVRHSYVQARNLEAVQSNNSRIRYLNESEFFKSTTNSTALELNSVFSNNVSNNLKVTYTAVRDDRDPYQGEGTQFDESENPNYFPYVDIQDGAGRITFGSEQFSTANALDQDIITITDNLEIYSGRHTIMLGTHNEFFSVYNLFIRQNFGVYEYDSLSQFLNDMPASTFFRSYSLVDNVVGDGSLAASDFAGAQFGVYVQDEIQVSSDFKLTAGVRLDLPVYFTDTRINDQFNNQTIPMLESAGYDVMGAQTGDFIGTPLLLSPRVGFNWDVTGEQTTQLRGGIGIFTSRIPLVWPGGSYNNNGFTVGGDFDGSPDFGVHDNPNWNQQPQNVQPGQGTPSGQVDLFAADFKVPQVLKFNVALDQKLPWGMIGNVDFIFNKTLNNVAYQNLNLKRSTESLTGTGDNRPIYDRRDEIDPTYSRIMLAYNTSEGYTWNITASLTKPISEGFMGMVAYSYGDAFTIYDGTSSQNSSQWRGLHSVGGRNFDQPLSRSDFSQGHRAIAALSYKLDWNAGKNVATTLSLFYEGISGQPFSYIYNDGGRLTNEDSRERALIYVPTSSSDIVLVDDGGRTASQQWSELDQFINDDPYLSTRRGMYAERNESRMAFSNIIDLKLLQDFVVRTGDKSHTLQATLDIFNFTNMLNPNWGRRYFSGSFGNYELLNFEGFESGTNTPTFTFDGVPEQGVQKDNIDDSGIQSSRWQMQIGIRYIFK